MRAVRRERQQSKTGKMGRETTRSRTFCAKYQKVINLSLKFKASRHDEEDAEWKERCTRNLFQCKLFNVIIISKLQTSLYLFPLTHLLQTPLHLEGFSIISSLLTLSNLFTKHKQFSSVKHHRWKAFWYPEIIQANARDCIVNDFVAKLQWLSVKILQDAIPLYSKIDAYFYVSLKDVAESGKCKKRCKYQSKKVEKKNKKYFLQEIK